MQTKDISKDLLQEMFLNSLKEGRNACFLSKGSCMQPLIQEADELKVKGSMPRFPTDIVVFRSNGCILAHRYIAKFKRGGQVFFLLKPDSKWGFDPWVARNKVLGVVQSIRREDKDIPLNTRSGAVRSIISGLVAHTRLLINLKASKKPFSNELRLLRSFLKLLYNETELDRFKSLFETELDWHYLTQKLKWNFFVPLFLNVVRSHGLEEYIPPEQRSILERVRSYHILHDTIVQKQLKLVLEKMSFASFPIVITKGAHLKQEVYQQSYLRWMGDIDMLVKPECFQSAVSLLENSGFKREKEGVFSPWALRYLDVHCDFHSDKCRIELKQNLWPIDFPYFTDSIFSNARKANIEEKEVFFPSKEETLLIACVNLCRHSYNGLIWFFDIKCILESFKEDLDWQSFNRIARKADLEAVCFYGLSFTCQLFDYPLDQARLALLKPNLLKRLLFNLFWDKKKILLFKQANQRRLKPPFELLFVLGCGKWSWQPFKCLRYIKYILIVLFPPFSYMRFRYDIQANQALLKTYALRAFGFLKAVMRFVLSFATDG